MKISPVSYQITSNSSSIRYNQSFSKPVSFGEYESGRDSYSYLKKMNSKINAEIEPIAKKAESLTKKEGKKFVNEALKALSKGAYEGFKSYKTNLNNKKDSPKLVFDEIDKNTGYPMSIKLIEARNGLNLTRIYEFKKTSPEKNNFDYLKVTEYKGDLEIEHLLDSNGAYCSYKETNIYTGDRLRITKLRNNEGFNFTEEKTDISEQSPAKILKEGYIYTDKSAPYNSIYRVLTEEGFKKFVKKPNSIWQENIMYVG